MIGFVRRLLGKSCHTAYKESKSPDVTQDLVRCRACETWYRARPRIKRQALMDMVE